MDYSESFVDCQSEKDFSDKDCLVVSHWFDILSYNQNMSFKKFDIALRKNSIPYNDL
jgi:hypothetical protein